MNTHKGPHLAAVPSEARNLARGTAPTAGDEALKTPKLDLLEGAQAFGLWLLLERPPLNDEKTRGGIILPQERRQRPTWIVRSKGEKVTIPVEVGDHVAFDGTRIQEDAESGRAWCFAMEGQIFGKLDPDKLVNRIITERAAI